MLDWESNAQEICEIIRNSSARIKVILKTKNENLLLDRWIRHHADIFDEQGIFVFDNGSDDEAVLDLYRQLQGRVSVFRFSAYVDSLHDNRHGFRAFYDALRSSSDYYCFLDTDEFVYWVEPDCRCLSDRTVLERMLASGEAVIPGIWAENIVGRYDAFLLTSRHNRLRSGIVNGKPMLSTGFDYDGFVNHNFHLPSGSFDGCKTGGLVIAHLKNFDVRQRVQANLEKLKAYNLATKVLHPLGIFGADFGVDDVLAIDVDTMVSGNTRTYVVEMQKLTARGATLSEADQAAFCEVRDGQLVFSQPDDAVEVMAFVANPSEMISQSFAK